MYRRTALQTIQRKDFGGTYYDSTSHAAMFRSYKPHNFGVKTAQLFSSELGSHLINKKFTFMTVAQNNCYRTPGGVDDYEWYLVADEDIDFRFEELLYAPDAKLGKGNLPFRVVINKPWLHEPAVLKLENSNLPMIKILGQGKPIGANKTEYEVELQTGDPSAWIPTKYVAKNRRAIRATTSVSDELNTKYAGVEFGEMFKLQSVIGNFANKCEFTDKFIRTEIACAKDGRPMPKSMGYSVGGKQQMGAGIGVGYVYAQNFKTHGTNEKNIITKGVFVTKMEALLLERTEMDAEMNMEFGQGQKTVDRDSNRTIKVPPGWRQIVRDGHYKQHNGTLTISDIYEYLAEIFLTRRAHSDRSIRLASGEPGSEFLHRLIAVEASQFQYIDTLFTKKRTDPQGYHSNELEYGAQFTKLKLPMGYELEIVHDPIKDDRKIFPELAPGTNRTLEGFNMDVFDFGATDQKAFDASSEENISCAMQDGVDSYFTVSNVYDFNTGAITDGSNARSNNKELGIYREMSRALVVWDVSRIGRLEYLPYSEAVREAWEQAE